MIASRCAAIVGLLLWWRGPGLGGVRGRLPGRRVGVGRRGRRAQPALDRRARARLENRDRPGDAAAAAARSGSSSPRSASVCSRTRCCPARIGELARVAVLTRRLPAADAAAGRRSSARSSPTGCSTSSRRSLLVVYVLAHGEDPALGADKPDRDRPRRSASASSSLAFVRRTPAAGVDELEGRGSLRLLVTMARQGSP